VYSALSKYRNVRMLQQHRHMAKNTCEKCQKKVKKVFFVNLSVQVHLHNDDVFEHAQSCHYVRMLR